MGVHEKNNSVAGFFFLNDEMIILFVILYSFWSSWERSIIGVLFVKIGGLYNFLNKWNI
jgi:hypothetical protein